MTISIRMISLLTGLALFGTVLSVQTAGAEIVTDGRDQTAVSITIYNSDLALVRDTRRLTLPKGEHVLAFKEISSRIRPATALIKGGSIDVIEQNFEFDLLTPKTLLNKYVGRFVTIARTNPATGEETRLKAKVLSTASGVVFQIGDTIETSLGGRLIYPDLPENLRETPTLTMLLDNSSSGSRDIELSYLTRGLSWRADYVAELNATEDRINLKGWVTLVNKSGARYEKAKLQLVAGEVNQARPERFRMRQKKATLMAAADSAPPKMKQESLLEYHLYTVQRPTTLKDKQSKQVALLQENDGVCQKKLVLNSASPGYFWRKSGLIFKKKSVDVFLMLKNDKASNFGLPKPAGVIRVYKKDSAGMAQFVGEDKIRHTPENETIELKLGRSFDVTADKRQLDFAYLSHDTSRVRIYESEYEIKLKNAKARAAVVDVKEYIPGEWKMLQQSSDHVKLSSSQVKWQVKVPAKGSVVLTYRVRVKQ